MVCKLIGTRTLWLILEKDDDDDDIAVHCRLITYFTTFSRKATLRGDHSFCQLSLKVVSTYLKAIFEFLLITYFTTFSRKAALGGDHGFCQLSLKGCKYLFESSFWVFAGSMVMKRDHIIGNLWNKYVLQNELFAFHGFASWLGWEVCDFRERCWQFLFLAGS